MKKILGLIVVALLVMGLVGGGTYAYFSDPETSTGNSFTAGTLDLSVDTANPWTGAQFTVSDVKPGDYDVATMTLTNEGNIGGTLTVDLKNLLDSAGTTPEPEPTPDNGELSANMDIALWVDANGDGVQDTGETLLYFGKLNAEVGPYTVGALDGGATTYVSLSYSIGSDVGNDIQGDISTFDIEFNLVQTP
jgi:predicted ribosomally synthesized peptide with SipW-like signal peptide